MSDTSMYASSDPRSGLSTAQTKGGAKVDGAQPFSSSSYVLIGEIEPQIEDENGRTWLGRGQNFIIAYTLAKPGAAFERKGQVDEYVLLIEAHEPRAIVTAGDETVEVPGYHIAMIPP